MGKSLGQLAGPKNHAWRDLETRSASVDNPFCGWIENCQKKINPSPQMGNVNGVANTVEVERLRAVRQITLTLDTWPRVFVDMDG